MTKSPLIRFILEAHTKMDFAAIAKAMEMNADSDSGSGSRTYSQEGDDLQPDEDFGTIMELPFPEFVFEKTFKG